MWDNTGKASAPTPAAATSTIWVANLGGFEK